MDDSNLSAMVAKIIISKSIGKALNYNEQKVQKSDATCIHAHNFLKKKEDMNFYQKLERFTDLTSRNDRAKTNSLHISLNFDPSEKLSGKKLTEIANTYMEKIGFGDQPYLVYQHHDAGHPHIHIVTTNIRIDGSRINTHNIGRTLSEPARKEIEKKFSLIPATGRNLREQNRIPAVDAEKVIYGKSETRRAIANVLDAVVNKYKYTSLPELNAVLKQYNVVADRGTENSRTYKHGGLVYRVLDNQGNKVGVPVKASSIPTRPTLSRLEKKFVENEEKRKPHRASLKERIDQALEKPSSAHAFIDNLKKRGIDIVFRQNEEGLIYGITYVDHKTKSVFNGSDLGKGYSASTMQEKLKEAIIKEQLRGQSERNTTSALKQKDNAKEIEMSRGNSSPGSPATSNDLFYELIKAENSYSYVPYELRKKKRKKKKRNPDL